MIPIIKDFLIESTENLAQLDLALSALDKDPSDRETLKRIFRVMHTLKGTAGFLGFDKLEALTRAAVNLLKRLLEEKLAPNRKAVSALLAVRDAVRGILASIESSGKEGEVRIDQLVHILQGQRRDFSDSNQEIRAGHEKQADTSAVGVKC